MKVTIYIEVEIVAEADVTFGTPATRDEPADAPEIDIREIKMNGHVVPQAWFTAAEIESINDQVWMAAETQREDRT